MSESLSVLFTGDIVLDVPNPLDPYFTPTKPHLDAADVVVGQVEMIYSSDAQSTSTDPGSGFRVRPSEDLKVVALAGVDVATMAGNHVFDSGPNAIESTLNALRSEGVQTVGAGMDLAEARRPAIVEVDGRRIAFLNYNTVGGRETWATETKAGNAYVWVLTHYETDIASPGMATPRVWTFADPDSLNKMKADISALREEVDFVFVSLHKGVVHAAGGALAMYETELSHAAIDAGADAVVGHHAHLLRGVEVYRGKPIFHGLSNFVAVTRTFGRTGEWAERRKRLNPTGFEIAPGYEDYPFHPDARYAALGLVDIDPTGKINASLLPLWVEPSGVPVPATHEKSTELLHYMQSLQDDAGFADVQLVLEEGRILVKTQEIPADTQ